MGTFYILAPDFTDAFGSVNTVVSDAVIEMTQLVLGLQNLKLQPEALVVPGTPIAAVAIVKNII